MAYQYKAFDLNIRSEIPFYDLPAREGVPDIWIKYGKVPESLPGAETKGVYFQAAPNEFLLHVDDIAGYYVSKGESIVVEPCKDAAEDDVLLFLMGSAMGAVLHQRNVLPLHGAAVEINGKGVVFAGNSGAGKSTLAAAFNKRGCRLLADDICSVIIKAGRPPMMAPGFPQLKLWMDTLNKLKTNTESLKTVRYAGKMKKYYLPVRETDHAPVPI